VAEAADTQVHRWHGRWIWSGQPKLARDGTDLAMVEREVDGVHLFRRSFDVEQVTATAVLRIAGDSRYVVWLNGVECVRGPIRGDPQRLHHDRLDVVAHLRTGENVLAVLVRYYGQPNAWWRPAPPTLTLGGGCLVAEIDLPDGILGTDRNWRATRGSAWTPAPPMNVVSPVFDEEFDAALLAPDWTTVGFDDSAWEPAVEIVAVHFGGHQESRPPSVPFGALPPNPMPPQVGAARRPEFVRVGPRIEGRDSRPRLELRRQLAGGDLTGGDPVTVPFDVHDGGVAVVDFGRTVAGYVTFDLEAPRGTVVDAGFVEELDADPLLLSSQDGGVRYTARGSEDRFKAIDRAGGRYLIVSVDGPGRVRVNDVAVSEQHRPRTGPARFSCSDPLLDQIWRIGMRTVDLCATDAYVDCPTREQRAWTGDAVVHQMVDLTTNEDWSLARWHPQMSASPRSDGMLPMAVAGDIEHANPGPLPDWALHWIRSVHNLYRYTGDRELVASLLGVAEGALRWFLPYLQSDGLVHEVEGWVLIDWASVQVSGCSSALNALWARALSDFAEMATWLGDGGRATWAWRLRDGVAEGLGRFWDPRRGGYLDHEVDGQVMPACSVHATAAAACAGIVPPERFGQAVELLTDRSRLLRHSYMYRDPAGDAARGAAIVFGRPAPTWDVEHAVIDAEPFYRYVVHDALAALGRPDLVADRCRDWGTFVADGESTWPETWNGGTHCHAWSSTPTRDLIVHTLGVTPDAPGYGRVRVSPALGDLTWAEGVVPTPAGPVTVRAETGRVSVDSPLPVVVRTRAEGTSRHLPPGRHEVATKEPGE
jgi:hypothetical protein